jgi:hypothetical protein
MLATWLAARSTELWLYDLYVRDELPAEIAESLDTLRQSWPPP